MHIQTGYIGISAGLTLGGTMHFLLPFLLPV